MVLNEKLVKYNFSSREGQPIKYIVIHDTGNTSKGADANAHFNFFNTGNRGASAHYFVDDKQVLRIIKDSDKSWHCGDGGGKYGITNENSIGVELCVNSDINPQKAYQNLIEITKMLMNKYNIHANNVTRHYDASRKICPNSWKGNNWMNWTKFKQDLKAKTNNHEEYVKMIYRKILRREVDEGGLKHWVEKFNQGMTKGDFLVNITESEEFKRIK